MSARFFLLAAMLVFAACEEGPPGMHVERSSVAAGQDIVVDFDHFFRGRATNQYWIALQHADAPESDTTGRIVLHRTETTVRLPTSVPGDLELRLHDQYPRREHHLVARIPVTVEGWQVKAAAAPLPLPNATGERRGAEP